MTDDVVVLLDADARPVGTAPRLEIHTAETPYHLAFSSYLFDDAGRLLLTRRALSKKTWPGVWTNSACGHPLPGEDPHDAVYRRVGDELGTQPTELRLVLPEFSYRAVDASGIVENEFCPVWAGKVDPSSVRPAPEEVMDIAWLAWDAVVQAAASTPQLLSPWCVEQIPLLAEHL